MALELEALQWLVPCISVLAQIAAVGAIGSGLVTIYNRARKEFK